MKYSELELATAIAACLDSINEHCGTPILEPLLKQFPCLDEIWQCGPKGPTGTGLGKYGGHAVE